MLKRVGFGVLVANFSVGNVPSELTQRSMTLFAKEVMPKLRPVNSDAPASRGGRALSVAHFPQEFIHDVAR